METAIYEAQASIYEEIDPSDFKHPLLTYVRFILADDKPNGNHEGVEYEDFPRLAQSALNMPLKMRLASNRLGGHPGSITVGHITKTEEVDLGDSGHQLIADGVIYNDEYPNETKYLKNAHASGNSPGISWELRYENSVKKNGTKWFKDFFTSAATFVKFPAYGTRTALLALASQRDISDDDLVLGLAQLANEIKPIINDKGGNTMTEEEVKALQTALADLQAENKKTEADLVSAKAEIVSKDDVIAQYEHATLVAERTQKVAEAGLKIETDATKLQAKQEFWASLKEEAFAEYLEDLQTALKVAPKVPDNRAQAGLKTPLIPKNLGTSTDGPTTFADLKNRMKNINLVVTE